MSFNLSFIRLTDQNRNILGSKVKTRYSSEGCGICEKEGAEVFWLSPQSSLYRIKL